MTVTIQRRESFRLQIRVSVRANAELTLTLSPGFTSAVISPYLAPTRGPRIPIIPLWRLGCRHVIDLLITGDSDTTPHLSPLVICPPGSQEEETPQLRDGR
ncbi:unnamed protein product [Ranitomeya imitator]|uniref:Uncharacterized protein n=1 Tax=Ranitomeya imitator TaxID=111125 RepID=A0ABN9MGV6_9NEOB|nr:unnamed protein product [Ranitomeya imitator]